MSTIVVTPWHDRNQRDSFLRAWGISENDQRIILQQDVNHEGCAKTKNKGILEAIRRGADIVIILDDDCYPNESEEIWIDEFIARHVQSLGTSEVNMFQTVTDPPSRGTPYFNRSIKMPVAASMGFWSHVGDYDAPGQLVHGATKPMEFRTEPIFGKYFPLCGMNLAFRTEWWPWCQFIDVPRFDDIWQGFLWQKKAYRLGYCFNINGPMVTHSRQSNVWANLRDEAIHLEANETLWQKIHESKETEYEALRALLPV